MYFFNISNLVTRDDDLKQALTYRIRPNLRLGEIYSVTTSPPFTSTRFGSVASVNRFRPMACLSPGGFPLEQCIRTSFLEPRPRLAMNGIMLLAVAFYLSTINMLSGRSLLSVGRSSLLFCLAACVDIISP